MRCLYAAFVLAFFTCQGFGAWAQVYVAPPPLGNDANAGTQAAPYATVQRAFDQAPTRSTVFLAPGRYEGILTLTGKSLRVVGTGSTPSVIANPASGLGNQILLRGTNIQSLRLENLHFEADMVRAYRGIWLSGNVDTVELRSVKIEAKASALPLTSTTLNNRNFLEYNALFVDNQRTTIATQVVLEGYVVDGFYNTSFPDPTTNLNNSAFFLSAANLRGCQVTAGGSFTTYTTQHGVQVPSHAKVCELTALRGIFADKCASVSIKGCRFFGGGIDIANSRAGAINQVDSNTIFTRYNLSSLVPDQITLRYQTRQTRSFVRGNLLLSFSGQDSMGTFPGTGISLQACRNVLVSNNTLKPDSAAKFYSAMYLDSDFTRDLMENPPSTVFPAGNIRIVGNRFLNAGRADSLIYGLAFSVRDNSQFNFPNRQASYDSLYIGGPSLAEANFFDSLHSDYARTLKYPIFGFSYRRLLDLSGNEFALGSQRIRPWENPTLTDAQHVALENRLTHYMDDTTCADIRLFSGVRAITGKNENNSLMRGADSLATGGKLIVATLTLSDNLTVRRKLRLSATVLNANLRKLRVLNDTLFASGFYLVTDSLQVRNGAFVKGGNFNLLNTGTLQEGEQAFVEGVVLANGLGTPGNLSLGNTGCSVSIPAGVNVGVVNLTRYTGPNQVRTSPGSGGASIAAWWELNSQTWPTDSITLTLAWKSGWEAGPLNLNRIQTWHRFNDGWNFVPTRTGFYAAAPARQVSFRFDQFGQFTVTDEARGLLVGLNPHEQESALRLYPLPAGNTLRVEGLTEAQDLRLFDVQGRLVRQQILNNGQNMDLSGLVPGLYRLQGTGWKRSIIKE